MKYILFILFISLIASCKEQDANNPPSNDYSRIINSLPENHSDCISNQEIINQLALNTQRCNWLSNYNLFYEISSSSIIPKNNIFQYFLNSELFTDFSNKKRFIFIPDNKKIHFSYTGNFVFPVGSVLIKTFSLNGNNRDQLKEIRLGIKKESGWIFIPYIWVEEKQDAFFYREGIKLQSLVDIESMPTIFTYEVPSSQNCLECHRHEYEEDIITFRPIGPKARHLNRNISINGEIVNQLTHWKEKGYITQLPNDLETIDTAPNWRDSTSDIQDRAKAYLDINCAHCHSEGGTAALSGLRLEYWRKSISHSHGVCNSSHGWRGGGFDIWPGQGEISSIPIRMRHKAAKDRMPPIGRSLIDEEAAQLIIDWIDTLPYQECAK